MAIFKCKMCGGTLNVNEGMTVCECEYCGTAQTLPKLDNEKRNQLFDRANHYRMNKEFDKASVVYENILAEAPNEAEAHWGMCLCRYGIEYVVDPKTNKRIPTCHRTQFKSILEDDDYLSAVKNCDGIARAIYNSEAMYIDNVQKQILEISSKEEPFDIFICYKENDNAGNRTTDSVIAQDIYNELTNQGYKVFFARITLEDKLGSAYEPYIFAALNSSKIMLVVGTKPEYFNAVWVKNEWSRYLSLIEQGQKKTLIPCYRDMTPYDLPDEFVALQSQDVSKVGYMQDLMRGIEKILCGNKLKNSVNKQTVDNNDSKVQSLLKRAFTYLEYGDWLHADQYCEKVLDIDAECAQAYLGKLMAQLRIHKEDNMANLKETRISMYDNFKKAYRFGDSSFKMKLDSFANEAEYCHAIRYLERAETYSDFQSVYKLFMNISNYKDSAEKMSLCLKLSEEVRINEAQEKAKKEKIYQYALTCKKENTIKDLQIAIEQFESIYDYKDSKFQISRCNSLIERVAKKDKIIMILLIVLNFLFIAPLNYKTTFDGMPSGIWAVLLFLATLAFMATLFFFKHFKKIKSKIISILYYYIFLCDIFQLLYMFLLMMDKK